MIHQTSGRPTLHELISIGRSACVPVSPLRQWAMRGGRRSREGEKSRGQARWQPWLRPAGQSRDRGVTDRGVERRICRLRHRHGDSRPRRPDTADGVSEKRSGSGMWAKIRFVRGSGRVRSAVRARTSIYGRCWAACPGRRGVGQGREQRNTCACVVSFRYGSLLVNANGWFCLWLSSRHRPIAQVIAGGSFARCAAVGTLDGTSAMIPAADHDGWRTETPALLFPPTPTPSALPPASICPPSRTVLLPPGRIARPRVWRTKETSLRRAKRPDAQRISCPIEPRGRRSARGGVRRTLFAG